MLQIIIVSLYVAVTIAIGIWTKKKTKSSRAFDGAELGMLLCVVAGAGEWLGGTATICELPTTAMTKISIVAETLLALSPRNRPMIPDTVPVPRLRNSFAKKTARKQMPTPFATVYHAPDSPYS